MVAPHARDAALIAALGRRLDPGDPMALTNLAWFAARVGHPADGLAAARRAAALPGAPAAAWRALERLAIGRTDGLVLAVGGANRDPTGTRSTALAAAVAAHRQAAVAVAEACYQAATGDSSLAAAAWNGLAVLHEQRHEQHAAEEAWQQALAEPTPPAVHNRALSLLQHGDLAAARALLATHQPMVTASAPLLYLVGYAALLDDDPPMARLSLEQGLLLDPDLARAQFTLGLVHELLGEHAESLTATRRGLLVSPWYVPQVWLLEPTPGGQLVELPAAEPGPVGIPDTVLLSLGRSLLTGGHFGESLAVFEQVLLRSQGHTAALFHRGVVLAKLRRYSEALDDWDRVRQAEPAGPLADTTGRLVESARRLATLFAAD